MSPLKQPTADIPTERPRTPAREDKLITQTITEPRWGTIKEHRWGEGAETRSTATGRERTH